MISPGAAVLFYKPNIDESVERFRKLWAREAQDRVLVKIDIQDPETPTVMRAMARVPDYDAMVDEERDMTVEGIKKKIMGEFENGVGPMGIKPGGEGMATHISSRTSFRDCCERDYPGNR
jgi:hypothetical protein